MTVCFITKSKTNLNLKIIYRLFDTYTIILPTNSYINNFRNLNADTVSASGGCFSVESYINFGKKKKIQDNKWVMFGSFVFSVAFFMLGLKYNPWEDHEIRTNHLLQRFHTLYKYNIIRNSFDIKLKIEINAAVCLISLRGSCENKRGVLFFCRCTNGIH